MARLDRSRVRIKRLGDPDDDFVPGTPAERWALAWQLTKELASLNKRYDCEQPLQRHITRLYRRKP
jgi:hypothetical protein